MIVDNYRVLHGTDQKVFDKHRDRIFHESGNKDQLCYM